ncbi:NUDIX hydrolase [Alloyangia pacifica]|uniref:NUDIX hydrolase n=1 Tax=Alloyangia pacifica TaxID=311180 RepID=UPI001CD6818D|nr:NUDIX hydrolase [Alloyangia pacifica]MCA0994456.1 NUDIX hydrolase [Alloyangia pacifica]
MTDLPWTMPLRDARDRENLRAVAALLRRVPQPYGRDPAQDHITGSGFVVSPCRGFTLLLHHAKLNRWLQPGGHCDGDPDVAAVAAREIFEETGLAARQLSGQLFDIDIHQIPARRSEPAHFHYDLRFLFEADPAIPLRRNAESHDLRWVALDDLPRYAPQPSVCVLREKLPLWRAESGD